MLQPRDHSSIQIKHLLRDESYMVWCYFYSPLCPESCIVKLWWQWVHTVYNLAFCISPAVLLKSFVAAPRVGFQQTVCLKFLLGKQEHTKQCASFPMPGAGEISLTSPNFKCRRKWIKQYKMSLQQNLLFYQRYTLSHLSWNPAMEGQRQNLCMFLSLHQKAPMSPHKFKLFAYYSSTTGLSGSSWSLRCRGEPTQGCRTHSVPIRAWGAARDPSKAHWRHCYGAVTSPCPLTPNSSTVLELSSPQTQPRLCLLKYTNSRQHLVACVPSNPSIQTPGHSWVMGQKASTELTLQFPSIKSGTASLGPRGPGIHHWSHSSFWSTDRKAY